MTVIRIRKKTRPAPEGAGEGTQEVFVVPAMAIHSPQGKKLIPNPAGTEACVFATLEEAEDAIRRAGFDAEFEGRKIYLQQRSRSPGPVPATGNALQYAVPVLIERLQDREAAVVANAAMALGYLQAPEAIEPLADVLGHDDAGVRKNVADAFARLGEPGLPTLKRAFENARGGREKNAIHLRLTVMTAYHEMVRAHRELLERFLPLAVEALSDENWLVRAQAALVVGEAAALMSEVLE